MESLQQIFLAQSCIFKLCILRGKSGLKYEEIRRIQYSVIFAEMQRILRDS